MNKVSANIYLRTLKAAFGIAVRFKLIEDNPFRNCKLFRVPPNEPAYVTKEGFAALLAALEKSWLRYIVVVAVLTGMRRGELVNLRWNDIDLRNRLIHIRNKEDFIVKSMRPRSIPINQDLLALLLRIPKGSEFLFIDEKGRPLKGSYVAKKFKQAARGCGLSERIHFHSLRHTYASWLVQSSTPLVEVQKLLGHSSVITTQIYSHLEENHLRAAAERIQLDQIVPKGLLE